MGFDPFKWRKRGIARLKDALEEQMPQYLERDERVVASMLGQTHPSAIGTELVASDGVSRILLTPVLDQHVLGAGHHVARRLHA